MSAASILHQGDRVSLVADGGRYDAEDGWKLAGTCSKIIDHPQARAAFGWRGSGDLAELLACRFRKARSLDEMLSMAVPALDLAVRFCRSRWVNPPAYALKLELKIIGWSDERDGLEGWSLSTDGMELRQVHYVAAAPFPCEHDDELWDILAAGRPMQDEAAWRALDTRMTAGALLDAQRRHWVVDEDNPGAFIVGGFGELVTMTRYSITRERIREWPDVVGQPIRPDAA